MNLELKKLERLARTLRQKRRLTAETLSRINSTTKNEHKLVFFKYPKSLTDELILSTKWLFNGFIIFLDKLTMLIDPGAEILSRSIDVKELLMTNTLYVSHGHIDHYAGAELAIEFMTLPKGKEVTILAPQDIFKRKLISDYHTGRDKKLKQIKTISLNGRTEVNLNGVVLTPIPLYHSIKENFGFVLKYKKLLIGYLSDTGYTRFFKTSENEIYPSGIGDYKGNFENIVIKRRKIKDIFSQVHILIVNINDLIFTKHSKYHLTGYDLIDILSNSSVKICFISNLYPVDLLGFNMAKKIAGFIRKRSKVETIAIPKSGLVFNLNKFI